MPSLDIYTSNESVGAMADYIRDGLDYARWERNCERLMGEANLRALHVMMTINGLCLFGLPDLLDRIVSWKERFGRATAPRWSVNILRFPSFMSPLALPDFIKDERREALRAWLEGPGRNPLVSEDERAGIARLVDYLEVVNDPHRAVSSMDGRRRDLKRFHAQYDRRRGKSIIYAGFPPEFLDWFDTL